MKQKNKFSFFLCLLIFSVTIFSCIPAQKVPKDAKMTDFFHFQKAEKYDAGQWAVFLPGTGGLRIFKDTLHYYKMADKLNNIGISVLLVDNVAAYKASGKKDSKEESDQILWTLNEALNWAIQREHISTNSKGTLVGWSRAGMAAIPLSENQKLLRDYGIKAMVLFYPANPHNISPKPEIPVLVLTGNDDRIIKVDDILDHLIAENINIKIYDNAYHGFDVESLEKGKYFRYVPFLSKKIYLLKYNETAAKEAVKDWLRFMEEQK